MLSLLSILRKFQFQTGAIRSDVDSRQSNGGGLFQFQTGAIRSASNPRLKIDVIMFQFQTGAIRRICR